MDFQKENHWKIKLWQRDSSFMFYFGFCAACVPHWFCCFEFDMRNIELPASTHLSPDAELSDARGMSGAP